MKDRENIQIADLVKAMVEAEPCLFGNSTANLMPVIVKQFEPLSETSND
jgi:hypothetical protein